MNHTETKIKHIKAIHDGIIIWDKFEYGEFRKRVLEEEGEKREGVAYVSPSSASVMIPGPGEFSRLEGSCRRSVWLKKMGFEVTDPPNAAGRRKMAMGKAIEAQEHEYSHHAGILVNKNVRLTHMLTPTCILKMEVDSVLKDGDDKYINEIKSFYGYWAKKQVFGTKTNPGGRPKIGHLMQALIYLQVLREKDTTIKYALLHYIDRSDAEEGTFIIELEEVKDDDGKVINGYPIIDGQTYKDVSLRDIYSRYLELGEHMVNKTIPPRDADPCWSEAKIQAMRNAEFMTKKAFTDWQNNKLSPKDWQCGYCDHKALCLGRSGKEPYPSDEEIMKTFPRKK